MEIYAENGSRIDCYFTSMEQCKEGTKSTPAICSNNPFYVAPPAEAAQTAPAPSTTPARSPRRWSWKFSLTSGWSSCDPPRDTPPSSRRGKSAFRSVCLHFPTQRKMLLLPRPSGCGV